MAWTDSLSYNWHLNRTPKDAEPVAMIRRSPTNLPLWVEFALLTLAVTSLCLVLGLLIRGFVSAGDGMVSLMQVRQAPQTATTSVHDYPVVEIFRATASDDQSPAAEADSSAVTPMPPASFDGRPLKAVGKINMLVTAYSPDARSCGKWADGKTASGYSVWTNGMKLVAADTRILPFGSIISVPGYNGGQPVQVLDRGGKIKGNRLDVLYPTHEIARRWGVQRLTVTVWKYAD
ncbi:MAG: 3D domain-containing protein [Phycisphaeraceae bacterium]|nr:3D domain-containing protein [Phycisphaeraceae bacterium]